MVSRLPVQRYRPLLHRHIAPPHSRARATPPLAGAAIAEPTDIPCALTQRDDIELPEGAILLRFDIVLHHGGTPKVHSTREARSCAETHRGTPCRPAEFVPTKSPRREFLLDRHFPLPRVSANPGRKTHIPMLYPTSSLGTSFLIYPMSTPPTPISRL
jgi:hypothetical protein